MRFMMLMIPKNYDFATPEQMVPADRVEAMMAYNKELEKAGVLVALDGLHPQSSGARVTFADGRPKVTDGPFPETKEVLGGYWMIKVKSRQEAIDWAVRCPASPDETIEIRQVQEMEDFPSDIQAIAQDFDEMRRIAEHRRQLFVNLPVKDLAKSKAFFAALGFTFNPQFTDDNAACMVVGDNVFAMLLTVPYFQTFTPRPVADAKATTQTLTAISMATRSEVDRITNAAVAAGGKTNGKPKDHGFMYQWSFEDLDGHLWEPFWMDPDFVQK